MSLIPILALGQLAGGHTHAREPATPHALDVRPLATKGAAEILS